MSRQTPVPFPDRNMRHDHHAASESLHFNRNVVREAVKITPWLSAAMNKVDTSDKQMLGLLYCSTTNMAEIKIADLEFNMTYLDKFYVYQIRGYSVDLSIDSVLEMIEDIGTTRVSKVYLDLENGYLCYVLNKSSSLSACVTSGKQPTQFCSVSTKRDLGQSRNMVRGVGSAREDDGDEFEREWSKIINGDLVDPEDHKLRDLVMHIIMAIKMSNPFDSVGMKVSVNTEITEPPFIVLEFSNFKSQIDIMSLRQIKNIQECHFESIKINIVGGIVSVCFCDRDRAPIDMSSVRKVMESKRKGNGNRSAKRSLSNKLVGSATLNGNGKRRRVTLDELCTIHTRASSSSSSNRNSVNDDEGDNREEEEEEKEDDDDYDGSRGGRRIRRRFW